MTFVEEFFTAEEKERIENAIQYAKDKGLDLEKLYNNIVKTPEETFFWSVEPLSEILFSAASCENSEKAKLIIDNLFEKGIVEIDSGFFIEICSPASESDIAGADKFLKDCIAENIERRKQNK